MDELSEEDKLTVERARKIQRWVCFSSWFVVSLQRLTPSRLDHPLVFDRFMSQPFAVAQVFTGIEGRLVKLKDTVQAFKEILAGQHDSLPENAFYSEYTAWKETVAGFRSLGWMGVIRIS